jgi:hypothetical protein
MAVTLTTNYNEVLLQETVEKIESFLESQYELSDMLEFIDAHGEEDFRQYYFDYCELGESHGYEPVDAFVELNDIRDLDSFERAYIGEYSSPAAMAEDFIDSSSCGMPYFIVVDYEATAEYLIDHEIDRVGNFYFRCHY